MKTSDNHKNQRQALYISLLIAVGIIIYLLLLQHPHSTSSVVIQPITGPLLSSSGFVAGTGDGSSLYVTVIGAFVNTGATPALVNFTIVNSYQVSGRPNIASTMLISLQPGAQTPVQLTDQNLVYPNTGPYSITLYVSFGGATQSFIWNYVTGHYPCNFNYANYVCYP
jgi:hypothetical protein